MFVSSKIHKVNESQRGVIMPKKPSKQTARKTRTRYRTRNWVFTLNNYTDMDCDWMCYIIGVPFSADNTINYIGVSQEVGKKKGTPHLQGFLQCLEKGMKRRMLSFALPSALKSRPARLKMTTKGGHRSGFSITPDL